MSKYVCFEPCGYINIHDINGQMVICDKNEISFPYIYKKTDSSKTKVIFYNNGKLRKFAYDYEEDAKKVLELILKK